MDTTTQLVAYAGNLVAEKVFETVAGKLIKTTIERRRKEKLIDFLTRLLGLGISDEELKSFLDDESQQDLLDKAIESSIKSFSKIGRAALARILADQIQRRQKFRPYEASKAVDLLQEIDDVECLTFVAIIEAGKNTENAVKTAVSIRPMVEGVAVKVDFQSLSSYKILPPSIENQFDLTEVADRLIQRGLLRRFGGFVGENGSDIEFGEFSLKMCEEIATAADQLGFEVPQAAQNQDT